MGDLDLSLGWEDPLENGTATHSSILAWRIPWTIRSQTQLSDFHFIGREEVKQNEKREEIVSNETIRINT